MLHGASFHRGRPRSTRAEKPITRVSEAREDIALGIELSVEGCAVDGDVRMILCQPTNAFGCSDDAEEANP